MCHMAALRRTKRYILKQARNRALPVWSCRHFQKLPSFENKYRDVTNLVSLSHNVANVLDAYSPPCSLCYGLHHLTNPMHLSLAPRPNQIAQHFH